MQGREAGSAARAAPVSHSVGDPYFRLRRNVVPTRYELEFHPVPHAVMFTGKAAILFEVREPFEDPQESLIVHALDLGISAAAVSILPVQRGSSATDEEVCLLASSCWCTPGTGGGAPPAPLEQPISCTGMRMRDNTSETCEMAFAAALPNTRGDRFVLLIRTFRGNIQSTSETYGLYNCSSRDCGVLSTQLEPTNSRRLFPCYDEPCFQSVFHLSVVADAEYTVISNTNVEREEAHAPDDALARSQGWGAPGTGACGKLRRTTFAATPPIHSCIVGFTIGKFLIVEQQSRKYGVLCRVIFPHTQPQHAGWFALDLLTKAIDFFGDFFDFALPLEKLDLVAVEAFGSLGMENWGMITILMDYLLVTEATPLERRQRITRLIGHEVCHHWFGNYASVAWWEFLWLKEGMCRYLEYHFADSVNPAWCIWSDFVGDIVDSALAADADPLMTHPVEYCDSHPRHILSSFDMISYAKGAALLRMLFMIIDVRTLKRAAHLLMTRHGGDCFGPVEFAATIHDAYDTIRGSAHGEDAALDLDCNVHALIDHVFALARVSGHPYVLVQCGAQSQQQQQQQQHAGGDGDGSLSTTMNLLAATGDSTMTDLMRGGRRSVGFRVSQFQMPVLHRGVLPFYVRQQRQRHGAGVIDLMTPPLSTSFEWLPEQTLRAIPASATYEFPIRVLECVTVPATMPISGVGGEDGMGCTPLPPLSPGPLTTPTASAVVTVLLSGRTLSHTDPGWRSALSTTVATAATGHAVAAAVSSSSDGTTGRSSPSPHGPVVSYYFNFGASGVFRCDYDIASWQRIFEMAPYLKDEDRVAITMTLCRMRAVNIGHFPYEDGQRDRCTLLLEWLMILTQAPAMMNARLWALITTHLEGFVYLTQNAYCSRIFGNFVSSVYRSLHQRCLLSFFPLEKTVNFQSHLHLLRSTVAGIMEVLALVGSPLIAEDCADVASWALAAIYPGTPFNLSTTGAGADTFGSSTAADLGGAGVGGYPVSMAVSQGERQTPDLAHSSGARPHPLTSLGTSPAGGGIGAAAAAPAGATHLDFENEAHVAAVMVSLRTVVQFGSVTAWAAVAGLLAAVTRRDVEQLERDMGVAVPTLPAPFNLRTDMAKLTALTPAFFTLDDDVAFEFMADVLQCFGRLSDASVKAILRNTRFLTYVLESRLPSVPPAVLRALILGGAELCSNGNVITLLKASVVRSGGEGAQGPAASPPTAQTDTLEQFRAIEFMEEVGAGSTPEDASDCLKTTAVPPPGGRTASPTASAASEKRRMLSPEIAAAFDRMESNCVWMDYCGEHYERFLREQRSRRMWAPCESQLDSRCTPIGAEHSTSTVGGSSAYPETVGGISI